jgi:hypothetical protein
MLQEQSNYGSTALIFDKLKEKTVALPPSVASIFDGSTLFLGEKNPQLLPEKLHQYLMFTGFGALGGWCDSLPLLACFSSKLAHLVWCTAAPCTALLGDLVLVAFPAADESAAQATRTFPA